MATAWLDSGTMWFVFIFIFAPGGMRHSPASRSISLHSALRTRRADPTNCRVLRGPSRQRNDRYCRSLQHAAGFYPAQHGQKLLPKPSSLDSFD
jgi:hypothetical protein